MEGVAWEAIFAAGTFFFLGAISPGPSVMVVIRNTIVGGRSQGVACAVGHGIGFGIYAISAVFGLIVLLENAPDVFLILQLIGVGLLIWYGYLMWFDDVNLDEKSGHNDDRVKRQGFIEGFSIAFFNPKIALFLVAVLAQVLEPGMGFATKLVIGMLGMSIDMIWYLVVALVLTGTGAVDWLRSKGQMIYRITAMALWLFAGSVLLTLF